MIKSNTRLKVISYLSFLTVCISALTFSASARPGGIDRSFGNNGIVITSHGTISEEGRSVVQSDGKSIFVGSVSSDFYAVRFNVDGSLDTTFDGDGRVTIPVSPRQDVASGVFVQTDGKILICGYSRHSNGSWDFAVVRLNPDGGLDMTFDGDGILIRSVSTTDDFARAVTVQPDGKIIVAGQGVTNRMNMTLVRYNADGSPDTTFGTDGIVITQFQEGPSTSSAVSIQSDGKIVVAGAVGAGGDFSLSSFGVARFNTNGSLDTGFGGDGTVFADVRIGPPQQNSAESFLIQPDNKIVVVGLSNSGLNASLDFAVLRLNPDGTTDDTFGTAGKVVTTIGPNDDFAKTVALQADGKILVGGRAQIGFELSFTLLRYKTNGTLDTQFGNKGVAFVRPETGGASISSLRIEPDGRIKAFGFGSSGIFVKFFQNGYIDADFDSDGKTDIGIFRPATSGAEWWINRSSDGSTFALQFGASTDKIAPADFTMDGKVDVAFFRPESGEWYVLRSEDFSFFAAPFGTNGDVPVPADYDGDGKADFAVFRPSSATWFVSRSAGGTTIEQFGASGDLPVAADYDGDGKADLAIYRPSVGEWWLNRSTAGVIAYGFGNSTDKAVPGDYTGDGKSDVAFWRPSTGEWYILRSEDTSFYSAPFGTTGDIPAPGDYDGDGKFDVTVFRPSAATWFSQRTTAGTLIQQFGAAGDRPIPNAFVP